VATSKVTPTRLNSIKMRDTSAAVSSSRWAVGSSAMRMGPRHHGAGDGQALLFAAGERHRHGLFAIEQADLVERGAHAPAGVAHGHAGDGQRQHDVVEDAAVVEQLLVLETMPRLRRR
jgi:hypothetical protein